MASYRYTISLRLRHPSMPASAIADALTMRPTYAWSVGERRTDYAGHELPGVHSKSYCSFHRVKNVRGAVVDGLETQVQDLERHRDFFRGFRDTGGRIELFVGWFSKDANTGDTLNSELLAKLGDLGIGLSFDIYANIGETPEGDGRG